MINEYMMIGEVLRPQGVHGEAKVRPYAADPASYMKWKTLFLKEGDTYTPISARTSRVHDGFAYITLGECATPEDVEKLRGVQLYIDRAHAGRLGKDEVYISDLIGCEAVTEEGEVLGTLQDVLQYGPTDVYVFKAPRGTFMAPALKRVFPDVDVAAHRIDVCRAALDEVAVFEE